MSEYHFWADGLNKFSQLTPWVQAFVSTVFCAAAFGIVHAVKEVVIAIAGCVRNGSD